MKKLEEEATILANESAKDMPAQTKGVLFVRGESQNKDFDEMGETKNPEEIELADDDSESDDSSDEEDDGMLTNSRNVSKKFWSKSLNEVAHQLLKIIFELFVRIRLDLLPNCALFFTLRFNTEYSLGDPENLIISYSIFTLCHVKL